MEGVKVFAKIQHSSGVAAARLYYGEGLDGRFSSVVMEDNGANGDALAGDGIFTGQIPGFASGTYIRFMLKQPQPMLREPLKTFIRKEQNTMYWCIRLPQTSAALQTL